MNFDRSKSANKVFSKHLQGNLLQNRVKNFIERQNSKSQVKESPNFKMNKSSELLTERTQVSLIEDSSINLSIETMKASKSSLKDLKKFQNMLKSQLNQKSSYSNSMILKKVNQKSEEVQNLLKILDNKQKNLMKYEQTLEEKYKNIKEKEKIIFKKPEIANKIDLSDTCNNFDDSNIKKKICFDEIFHSDNKNQEVQTPGFSAQPSLFKNQIEMSKFETELRVKSLELSKIAEDLKTKEKKITNDAFLLRNKQTEMLKKENCLKILEKNLTDRKNLVEKGEKFNTCKTIVNEIIFKSLDEILSTEKNKILLFQEKIQKDYEEIMNYESKILEEYANRKKELEKKSEKLMQEEKKVFRQLKQLSENNSDKILQEKLEDLEKREAKLRYKHLELLEFKENLKDKEEELLEKEFILKTQFSSINRDSISQDKELEISKRKSELEKFKESLLIEWSSNRNSDEIVDERVSRKEQELVEIWKILQEKEQALAEKACEMQELASIMLSKIDPSHSSVLDKLLYDSLQ